jgi:iron-sulfur cluster assembly accessory protein
MNNVTETSAEPVVSLTESAANEMRAKLAREGGEVKFLRVYIEEGGCSGKQYGMVFDERRPDDVFGEFFGVGLVVDPFSAGYLRGTVVDFVDALTGGGFKISNPNARQSCGCGKSFES